MRVNSVQNMVQVQSGSSQTRTEETQGTSQAVSNVSAQTEQSAKVEKTDQTKVVIEASADAAEKTEKTETGAQTAAEIAAENERIKKAISSINKKMNGNTEAVFGYHDATNRITIKMIDKDTNEVIREFPPEKTLDMIAKVWELAGIMVDEKG